MSYGICRVTKVKSASGITGAQIHDRRERSHSNTNPDIDFSRCGENYAFRDVNMEKYDSYNDYINQQIKARYKGTRSIRKDAVKMIKVIFTSDSAFFEGKSAAEQRSFFQSCLDFAKRHWGAENIVSAIVHNDEKTPHLHLNFIPLTADGRLSAKDMLGGKKEMQQLQDDFYSEVAEKYSLERGSRADLDNPDDIPRKHDSVADFKRKTKSKQLDAEIAEKGKQVEHLDGEISTKEMILEWRQQAVTSAEQVIDKLDAEYQEKNAAVEQLDAELTEKSAALTETAAALADNQAQLQESAEKVAQLRSIDDIEKKKSLFGGKVTMAQEDYDKVSDLAKKQIAAESNEEFLRGRVSALAGEKKQLVEENERLTEQNAELRRENGQLQSVSGKIAIATLRSERDNLQRKLDSVQQKLNAALEFIKGQGLWDKLKALFPVFDTGARKGQRR